MKNLKLKHNVRLAVISLFAVFALTAYGHEGHNKPAPANANAEHSASTVPGQPVPTPSGGMTTEQADGHLEEFPTLHPLVVHFPIMLLMLAAVIQIIGLAVFKREFGWLVLGMTFVGVVGAWLASNTFHPHTTGLSPAAEQILLEHEQFAEATFWLGLAGLVLKAVSMFFLKMKWWAETLATMVLVAAAVAVAIAGHHGAELVHKFGVGAKGAFLEMHDH